MEVISAMQRLHCQAICPYNLGLTLRTKLASSSGVQICTPFTPVDIMAHRLPARSDRAAPLHACAQVQRRAAMQGVGTSLLSFVMRGLERVLVGPLSALETLCRDRSTVAAFSATQ